MIVTVLFVCTGNTCRSPLAEGIARKMAAERGLQGVTFASAGVSAYNGAPASDGAVLIGLERGLDIDSHVAREFTADLVDADTVVLTMSANHLPAVKSIAPDARVFLLDDFASRGRHRRSVADPFGGDLDGYRATADEIEAMVSDALDRLATDHFVQRG